MKESTIRKLAEAKGLKSINLFIRFFMRRFPNEDNNIHSYCNEWIDRFIGGNPMTYMDSESKEIYLEVLAE